MRNLFKLFQRGLARTVPRVGDPVFWAPKGLECVVTATNPNGSFLFQGGELVTNKMGRVTPRWTVAAGADSCLYDAELKVWIVGQGPLPRSVRGTIITPEPVQLSGQATGSFAVKVEGS